MRDTRKKHLKIQSRKPLACILIMALILGCIPGNGYGLRVHAEEHENVKMANTNLMVNDYIGLFVNSGGKFSMGTTGGNPENDADNNQNLLYGYPASCSSYATFCIDGAAYSFSGSGAAFNTDAASHTAEQNRNGIHIVQTLSFCKNSATGREDVVEVKYLVTNNADVDRNVGCRIMMDTQLGENDRAPFRIPGYGEITTETEFEGEEIPQIWQVFNSLRNPKVVAQGRFFKSEEDRPDKVQFANWRRLNDTNWELKINKGSGNGDSAVAATWYEKALAPGESREYKTYYGLSELTQELTGPLILGAYSESELEAVDNRYAPNPFPVNAYMENIGAETMENVRVSLELPEGLSFAEGSRETIEIGEVKTNAVVQKNWQVKAEPSAVEQYYKLRVRLTYGNGETKSVTRTVHVPALKQKAVPEALSYTLFSKSGEENLAMYGWQSYITGDVYSGKDYIYQGSILNIAGKADTVGAVNMNGWQVHIDEANENQEPVEMPDLDADVMKKAGDTESYVESKTFSEDTAILEKSIYSEKDITFAGTIFAGNGYVIAGENITVNLNQGSTYNDGKVVMYAKQGDITLNGSEIALDGILYAPNGTVYVNANIFRLRGRIIAKHIVMNTSQNYIEGDESDIYYVYDAGEEEKELETEKKGFYEKTFLEEEIAQEMSEDGIWTTVCDAGVQATDWKHVMWNGVRADDSDIEVTVAVSEDGENYSESMAVSNGAELAGIQGRYVRVNARLSESSSGILPRLIDVTVSTEPADLVTNAAPVLSLSKDTYEAEIGVPVTVLLGSFDDALGGRSRYEMNLNAENEEQENAVSITDRLPVEKEICIQKSGMYDFTVSVTDGEFYSEQIISVWVKESGEEENPDIGEEQEYLLISKIERIAFNEDFSSLQIVGTASAEGHLKNYQLFFGKAGEELQLIAEAEQEIKEAILGEIRTEEMENGSYVLLLKAEDENGNILECQAGFELNAGQVIPGENKGDTPSTGETGEGEEAGRKLSEEELGILRGARQRAAVWLKAQADENGSWSRDGLMNTTCDALAVLSLAGETVQSPAYDTWLSGRDAWNVDEQCHAVWGRPDAEAMGRIWQQQNADGGFGLTGGYESDLYDTLLVLKTEMYIREMGCPAADSGRLGNALGYIASRRHADGGFGYNEKDQSRILLTAEYAIILRKMQLSITDDGGMELFCTERYTGDFSETEFLEQGMLARLQQQIQGGSYTKEHMQEILSVQGENGSIYDNVEDTMVFIVLMDEMIKGGE
ncbi:MAG: NEW3 domain-containing protein [Bacteroidales bacterium]|nr:NEW3 domain-containing protein [Clostridium sp.]MCM1204049.1 NEW3 domain-containing protein [Bacteroidales bacterium]